MTEFEQYALDDIACSQIKVHKTERALATIRKIAEIQPIQGADAIEAVRVDGWWVVAKKGEYAVDQLAVYLEIDSWVPTAIAPFLTKAGHEPKEFEGVKGERLRTVKLRGQVSQGLLLSTEILSPLVAGEDDSFDCPVGYDVTEILGILKYEKPLPAALAGLAKGNFPSFIPKTDQPRVQNCGRLLADNAATIWEVTEKLDGSSMTVYAQFLNKFNSEEPSYVEGVCSRNLDLQRDEANSFWEAAIKYDLHNKIMSTGRSLAIQGELVGEGIQGNSYKIQGRQFFCFDIWDIDNQCYLLPEERRNLCHDLEIQHVPYLGESLTASQEWFLLDAEGKSQIGCKPEQEGKVFKATNKHDVSFKAISNKWLLKNGE